MANMARNLTGLGAEHLQVKTGELEKREAAKDGLLARLSRLPRKIDSDMLSGMISTKLLRLCPPPPKKKKKKEKKQTLPPPPPPVFLQGP